MSEHKSNTTRYWKRAEPDSTIVYFFTESNASHARAETDLRTVEIERDEYDANVPVEARDEPYDATNGHTHAPTHPEPPSKPVAPPSAEEAVAAYQQRSVMVMLTLHRDITQKLVEAPLTHAERIFILDAIKHEFMTNLMRPQPGIPPVQH